MPRVGRNDPCPCGSGKKYKNCCMRQDRVSESRELSLTQGDGYLLNRLYDYAQGPRFTRDLAEAFALYWGGVYDLRGIAQIDAEDVHRTLEWFVHDYRTSADGRQVIDLFIETQASDYAPEARERLRAWAASVTGLFRAVRSADGSLELYDPLQERRLQIDAPIISRIVQPADLIIGRLAELNGRHLLLPMTLILPAEYEVALVGYLAKAHQRYVADHYQASWDQFLRESGHIFHAYLLSPEAEALRSLIGPGTRFHDPAISRDKLRQFTAQSRAERRRHQAEASEKRPPEHRTASGILLPGAEPEGAPEEAAGRRPTILIPGRDT